MAQPRLKRANPNTIQDKLLVGYQGWFTCAGDGDTIGPGHHGWLHWFNSPIPSGGRPNTDLWPDTSEYDPSELFPAPGLTARSGDPVHLFSSRNPRTVQRHFHWMALHGVDGAFLQRFASECEVKRENRGIRDLRDEVGDRVREAAEAEGRVFAIMYDVSNVPLDKIRAILEQDWAHLVADKQILDSPNYLRENGRPVVELWGFGFNGRNHTPELLRVITEFFRSYTPGGVYLIAGVPGHWRTSTSDADRNAEFVQVWTNCFDAVSPWTIGRYANEEDADRWYEGRVKADAEYLKTLHERGGRKVDYMPVVFPGGSGFNLSRGKWGMNDIRRNGGRFLWRQIYNAHRAGVRTIYGAMWDEYDEGTALMPIVSHTSQVPIHSSFKFIALDVDGHELPSDWYMRISGFAAEALHGERTLSDTLPFKELQDYWNTRPRYERVDRLRGREQADVEGVTRAVGEWQVSGSREDVPADAPPPYSLEDASARPGSRAQQEHQRTGRTTRPPPPPPVPHSSRPSQSQSALSIAKHAAAVPFTAATVAHTLSAKSASGQRHPSLPPPVDMSTRPMAPPPPHHAAQNTMVPPLQTSALGHGHAYGQMPEPDAVPQSASMHRPHYVGSVHTFGRVARPRDKYARGRSRSRSHSHSRSRSGSRRRRSSSGGRHKGGSPVHAQHAVHVHGNQSYGHGHSHSHSLSPVGSSQGMAFPTPAGLLHAHSDSGYADGRGHGHGYEPVRHGSYTPAYSAPVGCGNVGQVVSPAAYAPYGGQNHPAYVTNYPNPGPNIHLGGYEAGFGFGYGQGPGQSQGQGYDGRPQPYPHGYTSHPSSSSHYTSYAPGTETPYGGGPIMAGSSGNANASGNGTGGIPAGIASALQAVEGLAGKNTRMQLEKTVKTLSNSLNKFK